MAPLEKWRDLHSCFTCSCTGTAKKLMLAAGIQNFQPFIIVVSRSCCSFLGISSALFMRARFHEKTAVRVQGANKSWLAETWKSWKRHEFRHMFHCVINSARFNQQLCKNLVKNSQVSMMYTVSDLRKKIDKILSRHHPIERIVPWKNWHSRCLLERIKDAPPNGPCNSPVKLKRSVPTEPKSKHSQSPPRVIVLSLFPSVLNEIEAIALSWHRCICAPRRGLAMNWIFTWSM